MDRFGSEWQDHPAKMAAHWRAVIAPEDLVLIAGDISWALKLEEALADLQWIDALPGTKVLIKGNHDYWWGSLSQVTKVLPPSIHLIQNNAFFWKGVAVGGARLWDTEEYSFGRYFTPNLQDPDVLLQRELNQRQFEKELHRLRLSLEKLDPQAPLKIAMTHYPPIGPDMDNSKASFLFEQFGIHTVVFGHLHGLSPDHAPPFGEKNQVRYLLTSADYLHFQPAPVGHLS
jgi:hypothetical protein